MLTWPSTTSSRSLQRCMKASICANMLDSSSTHSSGLCLLWTPLRWLYVSFHAWQQQMLSSSALRLRSTKPSKMSSRESWATQRLMMSLLICDERKRKWIVLWQEHRCMFATCLLIKWRYVLLHAHAHLCQHVMTTTLRSVIFII